MDERVIIRHLNLGKANQAEEFPLKDFKEIVAGREPTVQIKYDPDRDDLVSRKHARINVDSENPLEFSIADLGSRNGTFVNKQRIFSPVKLQPGDVVQLGAGGPEFQFDIEPRPANMLRPTRMGERSSEQSGPPVFVSPTRESGAPGLYAAPIPPTMPAQFPLPPPNQGVGKATVERMILQTKTQTRNSMLIGGLVLLAIIAAVATYFVLRTPKTTVVGKNDPKSPTATAIAAMATDSVVFIEVGWKLYDTDSGRQLSQVYLKNEVEDSKTKKMRRRVDDSADYIPAFIDFRGRRVPVLSTESSGYGGFKYVPIGEQHSGAGSGFVVSATGFILTNRHVAADWYHPYDWFPRDHWAALLDVETDKKTGRDVFGLKGYVRAPFPEWIPKDGGVVIEGPFSLDNAKVVQRQASGESIEGRDDFLNVTFAKTRIRIPAKLARVSDYEDVAMIRIEMPGPVRELKLNDNLDTIKPGDPVVVMGYPGMTTFMMTQSGEAGSERKIIPDPTVNVGNIGRVVKKGEAGEGVQRGWKNRYQVNVANTGSGNSGGPVFDADGRVIGIFTEGAVTSSGTYYFAVPIRFGIEIMGIGTK